MMLWLDIFRCICVGCGERISEVGSQADVSVRVAAWKIWKFHAVDSGRRSAFMMALVDIGWMVSGWSFWCLLV